MTPTVDIIIKGTPLPIRPKCQSIYIFGDDSGDNSCTFHCEREEGHNGLHCETGTMYGLKYILHWEGNVADWDKKQMEAEHAGSVQEG